MSAAGKLGKNRDVIVANNDTFKNKQEVMKNKTKLRNKQRYDCKGKGHSKDFEKQSKRGGEEVSV